ncbi:MAG: hypothetical protein HY240_07900 [Actinobacteria bacterium]|nr:hypothetical protein [Actinomycetota bacterium]
MLAVVQDRWQVSEVARRLGVSRQSVHTFSGIFWRAPFAAWEPEYRCGSPGRPGVGHHGQDRRHSHRAHLRQDRRVDPIDRHPLRPAARTSGLARGRAARSEVSHHLAAR